MEYQQIVIPLPDLEADRAAAADQLEVRRRLLLRQLDVEAVRSAMDSVMHEQWAHTFVMVSSQTLAALGVLDKIERHFVGASFPSNLREEARAERLGNQREQLPDRFQALYEASFRRHVFFGGGSAQSDPLSQVPLTLEVEDLSFVDDDGSRHDARETRHFNLSAFKRLHALLGELVEQDKTSPDVISSADNPYELLDAKTFAGRMGVTDQTVYNREKAGLLISVLPHGRMRKRCFPCFQLSPRLNEELHQLAIAMYRSHGQDMTFYWDFLRTRHKDFGGSTGVDFLLNRMSDPSLLDLEQSDRQAIFLALAEEDMSRASA